MTAARRLALPGDCERIHAISSAPSVAPYLTYEPMPLAAFRPIFEEALAASDFYVWEAQGRVVGCYRIMRFPGRTRHVALLGWVAVDPELHGQGHGLTMLRDAVEHLRAAGVRRLELQAEADNARGLAFYRKLGFVAESVQRDACWRAGDAAPVDEILMVKFLQA